MAQEAFVKALRSMHSLAGERRFYPWMTVIAKRISIDRHRQQARVELTDEPDLGDFLAQALHILTGSTAEAPVDLRLQRNYWACIAVDHLEVGLCLENPLPDLSGLPTVPDILNTLLESIPST